MNPRTELSSGGTLPRPNAVLLSTLRTEPHSAPVFWDNLSLGAFLPPSSHGNLPARDHGPLLFHFTLLLLFSAMVLIVSPFPRHYDSLACERGRSKQSETGRNRQRNRLQGIKMLLIYYQNYKSDYSLFQLKIVKSLPGA